MKIILSIVALAFNLVGFAQNNKMILNSHLDKLKNAKLYALSIANSLDENKFDFKPVKEEMSFNDQLVHIGENIYWLSSTYIKEENNPMKDNKPNAKAMSKKEVLAFLNGAYNYAINAISELDSTSLSKEYSWNGGKLNKYQFLNLIQDHQSHHIGQLIVYLRINGIEPPKYIGW